MPISGDLKLKLFLGVGCAYIQSGGNPASNITALPLRYHVIILPLFFIWFCFACM